MTKAAKAHSPSGIATASFYLSFVFMASGALNYGVTTYFWAAPFAIYAVRYAARTYQSHWPVLGVVTFIGLGVLFNETIEKNPVVFPILNDGYLQEVRRTTGVQSQTSSEPSGDCLRVAGVRLGHADLGTTVELIGSDGRIYVNDSNEQLFYTYTGAKKSSNGFRPSGPLEHPVLKRAGELMWYPWLPFVAYQGIKGALIPDAT